MITKQNDFICKLIREELNKFGMCNYFNIETVGMDYYDNIIKNGIYDKHPSPNSQIIIDIDNPIKFILKYVSKDEYGNIIKRTLTNPNYIQNDKILKIMDNMQKGVKYNTPMVDLVDKYLFQEGRHRVIAATNLGCKLVPVYIFGTDEQLKKF